MAGRPSSLSSRSHRVAAAILVLTLWSAGTGALPVSAQSGTDIDIPFQKFVLDNGLTLVVHEDHKAPIVAVNVWYHVGSKNEKPGKTGFAHLFEHLMFAGSEHSPGRYVDTMEKIGATDLNGTTNNDRTNYFETVPTSALDFTLWMESDRMGYLLGALDQKALDLQRGVVQNEKRQGQNQPYSIAFQLMAQKSYPAGHPYSWPVIGEMADLDAASMRDVKEWFKTYYGPSNVTIVLAGDIDAREAKKKVAKYFGNIPPGPPVTHEQVWIAKMTGTHRQIAQDRVPQARIYKVWNIPEFGSADADYLDMVSDVLASGKTSRFYKRLVYDHQIATDAGASANANEIGGQFLVQATARPGTDLRAVESDLDEELARFLKDGPTAEELARVKVQLEGDLVRSAGRIGGFGGKSDRLAQSEVFLGSPDAYKISLKRVRHATAEDLRAAANRWLSDGVYILEVLPFPEYKATAEGADRSTPPTVGASPDLKFPRLQHATLSNGLKVILAERHEVPLIDSWLTVDAGYAADQSGLAGTANMAMALLMGGTKTRTALQISDEQAQLGARLWASSNLDLSVVQLSALKSKLGPSLDLFADVILNPIFPESDFKRQQELQLAAVEREKNSPIPMGLRLFPALLYGSAHAYGNPLTGSGTAASVSKITREMLIRFHEAWFKPNHAVLVIAGDTTLAEITPKLETLFAGWKSGEIPEKNIRNVELPVRCGVYLIDKPGASQSVILAGNVAPPRANPQEIALEAANDALGGMFGSRLNLDLREDKHWSYRAQTLLWEARGQRPFLAVAPVQTDKTKESLAEMNKIFHDFLREHPITTEELARVQANETLSLPGSLETVGALGQSILNIVRFGLPEDYYETYAGKVRALKVGEVGEGAKAMVHPDRLIWVVVGDRAKIEADVRALNLGDFHVLDSDGKPQ